MEGNAANRQQQSGKVCNRQCGTQTQNARANPKVVQAAGRTQAACGCVTWGSNPRQAARQYAAARRPVGRHAIQGRCGQACAVVCGNCAGTRGGVGCVGGGVQPAAAMACAYACIRRNGTQMGEGSRPGKEGCVKVGRTVVGSCGRHVRHCGVARWVVGDVPAGGRVKGKGVVRCPGKACLVAWCSEPGWQVT